MNPVKTSADPAFVDLRDDLLFQSAQSDGKGGLRPPYMRDLSDRLPPMKPRLPLIDASGPAKATPDPRDALIAELCEALEALSNAKMLQQIRPLVAGWNGENRDKPYEPHPAKLGVNLRTCAGDVYAIDKAIINASAALRRARGQE